MATLLLRDLRLSYTKIRHFKAVFYTTQPERANKIKIGKVVNVAIIGAPNSGKSTLINHITGRKVLIQSYFSKTKLNLKIRSFEYPNFYI